MERGKYWLKNAISVSLHTAIRSTAQHHSIYFLIISLLFISPNQILESFGNTPFLMREEGWVGNGRDWFQRYGRQKRVKKIESMDFLREVGKAGYPWHWQIEWKHHNLLTKVYVNFRLAYKYKRKMVHLILSLRNCCFSPNFLPLGKGRCMYIFMVMWHKTTPFLLLIQVHLTISVP